MPIQQQVQDCINTCTQLANEIRSVANGVQEQRSRYMLTEAAGHVEICIDTCNQAQQPIQRPV
ncbi:hypothetical protein [Limnochorda pilosa]|uniref:Uncharacterized protein n=1 Tax=Limnochorda pilosa TaxID=1555112 RepID=A0A0K2SR19_LIMPI|nr:hypothetical protein [Limnochorda pilosa]BAS29264.1 hypothetical protein LIP_3452 [Limnochorda pilosa]